MHPMRYQTVCIIQSTLLTLTRINTAVISGEKNVGSNHYPIMQVDSSQITPYKT